MATLRERVVQCYGERVREVAKQMAERIGQPLGTTQLSRDEQVRLWLHRAPGIDLPALLAQGVPPAQAVDAAYPYRMKLIGKGRPSELVKRAEAFERMAMEWLQQRQEQESGTLDVLAEVA